MPADVTVTIPGWALTAAAVAGYVWVLAGVAVTLEAVWHERHDLTEALGARRRPWRLLALPFFVLMSIIIMWPWVLHDRVLSVRAARRTREKRARRAQEYPW